MTLNVCVAETLEEAERRALPQLLQMVALRTGQPLTPQPLVEEAAEVEVPEPHRRLIEAMRSRWVIGSPDQARARIAELAATFAVDEVMLHPVSGATRGTEATLSPGREESLRLLAAG